MENVGEKVKIPQLLAFSWLYGHKRTLGGSWQGELCPSRAEISPLKENQAPLQLYENEKYFDLLVPSYDNFFFSGGWEFLAPPFAQTNQAMSACLRSYRKKKLDQRIKKQLIMIKIANSSEISVISICDYWFIVRSSLVIQVI